MSQSKLVTGLVASLAVGLALVARAASADAGPGASHDAGDRPSPYAPAPRYTGVERSGRYLTMRDGVRIAIELYLPPGLEPDARIPTILHQTRYWRAKSLRWPASAVVDELSTQGRIGEFKRRAVEQGYAWVDVDTRGSGASFGNRPWDYSPDEIQDGAQIVDWIIGQPWSNGRVGAAGASYSGSSAEFALLARHPAVRAVAPMLCEFDQYTDILAPGGVPFAGFFEQWGSITGMLDRGEVPRLRWGWQFVRGVRPVDEDRDGALLAAALADHAQNYDFQSLARVVFRDDLPFDPAAPAPPLRREAMQRAFRFFEQRFGPGFLARGIDLASAHAYEAELAGSAAPVYAISGWLDGPYANAAVKRFLAHPRPGNKLLIGAWDHTLQEASPFGPGGPARFDLAGELLKFFDRYLKELDDGIDREAPVHYFTMGDERWQAASTWPPAATLRRFHLAAGGRLALEPPPAGDGADAFHVDPATGAGHETRWDALLGRTFARAYPDRATRDRSLLVYTSDPLPTDAEVT